jgi:hypothetical protein
MIRQNAFRLFSFCGIGVVLAYVGHPLLSVGDGEGDGVRFLSGAACPRWKHKRPIGGIGPGNVDLRPLDDDPPFGSLHDAEGKVRIDPLFQLLIPAAPGFGHRPGDSEVLRLDVSEEFHKPLVIGCLLVPIHLEGGCSQGVVEIARFPVEVTGPPEKASPLALEFQGPFVAGLVRLHNGPGYGVFCDALHALSVHIDARFRRLGSL